MDNFETIFQRLTYKSFRYDLASDATIRKSLSGQELASEYINLYNRFLTLANDYITLMRQNSQLKNENEFMVKTLNEECNK